MSQRDRVLKMLRTAGARGVHTVDLRKAYVANPSQRIAELEAEGHTITHARERSPYGDSNGCRYTLSEAAGSFSEPMGVAEADTHLVASERLFDPPHKPLGAYEDAA